MQVGNAGEAEEPLLLFIILGVPNRQNLCYTDKNKLPERGRDHL